MKVILESLQHEAPGIQSFLFRKPAHFRYTAGQFIELYLPHDIADDRGQKRWFTLSSSPTEDHLMITTRGYGGDSSSFKQQLFALKPGDSVEMSDPMGDFVLPKDTHIPLVFVAGGIGVTPFRSIAQWLIDHDEQRHIQFLYGVKSNQELIFLDAFNKLGVPPQAITDKPLTAELIETQANGIDDKLVFISGPEPMTEKIVEDLKEKGFPYEQLVTDYFPGYPAR